MEKKLNCIMLIDDNSDDNYFHQRLLKKTDAANHIQITDSGFVALDYLSGESLIPELIFLDINMPKMNGWEFLEEYSKLNENKKARQVIIMLTTSLNPADEKKAQSLSVISGFESKPLTAEKLQKILERFF
jgi:CheY-like chemotaxis protein